MFMQEKDLSAEIKSSSVAGTYFLFGEEDYLKRHRTGEIRSSLFSADGTMEAFNAVSAELPLYPLEMNGRLCAEIDNGEDYAAVTARFAEILKGM